MASAIPQQHHRDPRQCVRFSVAKTGSYANRSWSPYDGNRPGRLRFRLRDFSSVRGSLVCDRRIV